MLHAQFRELEKRLASCLALLNERAEARRQLAEQARGKGGRHDLLDAARDEALERARTLQALLEREWTFAEGGAFDATGQAAADRDKADRNPR